MATRKKKTAKKKVLRKRSQPTVNQLALALRDDVLHALNVIRAGDETLKSELVAMREAIERLDVTIAKALAEAATKIEIDPTLFPGKQDGGVPTGVAPKQYDELLV